MNNKKYCNHEWEIKNNYEICKLCGLKHLALQDTEKFDLKIGIKGDGKKYSVRDYRKRYFFPDEWIKFYESINNKNKTLFDTLIMTGARIEEALKIKVNNFRFDKNYVTLYVTKRKAKKREIKPKPRDISLSSKYIRRIKKFIKENNLKDDDYLFLDKNKDIKKQINSISVSSRKILKSHLKKNKIEDYYNFSLHNIRKTHGMWLKALKIDVQEICQRLGHNYDTYTEHYGSSDLFKPFHLVKMKQILGDIYGF